MDHPRICINVATQFYHIYLIVIYKQVYIVYLGHLPSTDASEPEGFSVVEFAHHDLLNKVLHDGRSEILFSPESNT